MKLAVLLMLITPLAVFAQDENQAQEPAPATAASPCTNEEFRQFDFWVGTWDVSQNGTPAGRNQISKVHNDCALAENWTSATGTFTGQSLNMYDRINNTWHQTWVDSSGTLLQLDGKLEDGNMVLSGPGKSTAGDDITHQITWTPNENGSVRQHWQTSSDGKTWTTAFDGLYERAE